MERNERLNGVGRVQGRMAAAYPAVPARIGRCIPAEGPLGLFTSPASIGRPRVQTFEHQAHNGVRGRAVRCLHGAIRPVRYQSPSKHDP
jgi:hypothetical protein